MKRLRNSIHYLPRDTLEEQLKLIDTFIQQAKYEDTFVTLGNEYDNLFWELDKADFAIVARFMKLMCASSFVGWARAFEEVEAIESRKKGRRKQATEPTAAELEEILLADVCRIVEQMKQETQV